MTRKIHFHSAAAALLTALSLVLGLTACGGSGSGNNQQAPQDSSQTAAQAGAVEEGLLRTAVLYDITTMDVTQTTDDYMVPMNVFDRLFETRTVEGTAQVVKSLCEEKRHCFLQRKRPDGVRRQIQF